LAIWNGPPLGVFIIRMYFIVNSLSVSAPRDGLHVH
jgi:hypothetical protein